MPFVHKFDIDTDSPIALWSVKEDEKYFLTKLHIFDHESLILDGLSRRKKLEWLASRYVLHLLSGRTDRARFDKDIHGKPHLIDSDYHVSISHSHDLIAVMASPLLIGIDVQYFVAKINRIAHKFVSPKEQAMITPQKKSLYYHILWGAKESLYKAYGRRELNFIDHIYISDLTIEGDSGKFKGIIKKGDYTGFFDCQYYLFDQYVLVYAKENT